MAIVVFDHYIAEFEYLSENNGVSLSINFSANNTPAAARDALRFFSSRQNLFPENFGKLLCVKIYGYTIGPIHEDGALLSRHTLCLFEWKIDGGYTYEEKVARAERWLEHSQRPDII